MKDSVTVDLAELRLYGEVIDLGCESSGVIYRALKNQSVCMDNNDETAVTVEEPDNTEDFNWVKGRPTKLPFKDSSFDNAAAFFSFSHIKNKRSINKTMKEIARILRKNGKLFIWDMNITSLSFWKKIRINTKLPGNESAVFDIRCSGFPGSFDIETMIPIVQKYFILNELKDQGEYFYIEACRKEYI
jgi:ubiquinone/menaquinone biosynthesis C-methylase UbiE